jgi:hypothetical protein
MGAPNWVGASLTSALQLQNLTGKKAARMGILIAPRIFNSILQKLLLGSKRLF